MDNDDERKSDISDELDNPTSTKICQITDTLLREVTGVVEIRKITSLDLHLRHRDAGKIRKIEGLQALSNLRILNLSYNVISVVEGLHNLENLLELNLAENSIRKFENFESLTKLQRLNLSGNQISRIPSNIHKLGSLQVLRFSRNNLSVLKDVSYLGDLPNLSSLTMEDNPIVTLEQCVPYTVYCVRSLSMLNNIKIVPAAREAAIKRFNATEVNKMKELLANEVRLQQDVGSAVSSSTFGSSRGERPGVARQHPYFESSQSQKTLSIADVLNNRVPDIGRELGRADFGRRNSNAADTNSNVEDDSVSVSVSEDSDVQYIHTDKFMPQRDHDHGPVVGGIAGAGSRLPLNRITLSASPPRGSDRRQQQNADSSSSSSSSSSVGHPLRTSKSSSPPHAHATTTVQPTTNGTASRQIMDLNARLEKLTMKLVESESQKKTLQEENRRVESLLSDKTQECNRLHRSHSEAEDQVEILKSKLQQEQDSVKELQMALARVQQQQTAAAQTYSHGRNDRKAQEGSFCENCEILKERIAHPETVDSVIKAKEAELGELFMEYRALEERYTAAEASRKLAENELSLLRTEHQQQQLFLHYQQSTINSGPLGEKYLSIDAQDIANATKETLVSLVNSLKKESAALRQQNQSQLESMERERHERVNRDRAEQGQSNELQVLHKCEVMKLNTQIDVLNQTISRNESALASAVKDIQIERERYSTLEMNFENSQRKNIALEEQGRNYDALVQESRTEINRMRESMENLQRSFQTEMHLKENAQKETERYKELAREREGDLSAYMTVAAPARRNAEQSAVKRDHTLAGKSVGAANRVDGGNAASVMSYLDGEDEDESDELYIGSAHFRARREAEKSAGDPPADGFEKEVNFSKLEILAAQSVAGLLLSELRSHGLVVDKTLGGAEIPSGPNLHLLPPALKRKLQQEQSRSKAGSSSITTGTSVPAPANDKAFRFACSNAALRLVHYIITKSQSVPSMKAGSSASASASLSESSPSKSRIPLLEQMLSNKEVLASVVNETHMGLTTIDESNAMKYEQRQLQVIINDLTEKEASISGIIAEKQRMLQDLSQEMLESKRHAEVTVAELEQLAGQVNTMRTEINTLAVEKSNQQRDIDIKRNDMTDLKNTILREQKSLNSLRERMNELSSEYQQINDQIIKSRENLASEEAKIRQIKVISVEQLHALQLDVNKLSSEFQEKQRVLEELERERKSAEEAADIRRREVDRQIAYLTKEVDDRTRKVSNLKNDSRTAQLECEALLNQKKQLEMEISHHNDILNNEISQLHSEQVQYKHLIEHYERLAKESERKQKTIKEKNSAYETEQIALRQSVEDLRLQQVELEKMQDSKRRAHEEELSQVQHQLQGAIRLSKQTITVTEQKRTELDSSMTELRSYERRVDELKRQCTELSMSGDHLKETIRHLELDREKRTKDLAAMQSEEHEAHKQVQILAIQITADTRNLEDLKRRVNTAAAEDARLRDSETKLRHSVASMRKNLDDMQVEAEQMRVDIDQERREYLELQAKRSSLEVTVEKTDEAQKTAKGQVLDDERRRLAAIAELNKLRDDNIRSQRDLVLAERRVTDAERREEEIKRKTEQQRLAHETLVAEIESLSMVKKNEKSQIDTLKTEFFEKQAELKSLQEELKSTEAILHRHQLGIDTTQMQQQHMEVVKDQLTEEIARLRQSLQNDTARSEKLELQYTEIESRLKVLRMDLSKQEVSRASLSERKCENISANQADCTLPCAVCFICIFYFIIVISCRMSAPRA